MRRRLADSPRQARLLEERLRETEASLAAVTAQNERLAGTLREARDQIVALKEEVDRLAQPPSGFGIFLEACDDEHRRRVHRRPEDAGQREPRRRAGARSGPARRSCSTRRSTSSSPRATRPSARSSCSRSSWRTASARWSSRTPTRSAWSGSPTRCAPRPCAAATRCCSSRAPATCTSGSPRPRSRSSSWRKSRTSPTPTSAAWPPRSSRSGTRSSCPTCTPTCSASTSCGRRRACCSTARPAAARR